MGAAGVGSRQTITKLPSAAEEAPLRLMVVVDLDRPNVTLLFRHAAVKHFKIIVEEMKG